MIGGGAQSVVAGHKTVLPVCLLTLQTDFLKFSKDPFSVTKNCISTVGQQALTHEENYVLKNTLEHVGKLRIAKSLIYGPYCFLCAV